MNHRLILIGALVLAFLMGGWVGDEARKKPERPVLKALMRLAKWGLFVVPFVLDEPDQPPRYNRAALGDDHIDHMRSL